MKTIRTGKLNFIKTILLTIGIAFTLRLASAQCDPPPSGIIAWWPGDGNANDITGTNNGILQNAVSFVAGEVAQAFSFDGVSSYIDVPSSPSLLPTNQFTIELWLFQKSANTVQGYRLIDKETAGTGDGLTFDTHDGSTGRRLRLVLSTSSFFNANTVYNLNMWHHAAVTYAGGTIQFFLDGVSDGSYSNVPPPLENNLDLFIGAPHAGCGGTCGLVEYFHGYMDEVSLYNRALSSNEITAIYSAGSAGKCKLSFTSQPQSQVGYWGQGVTFNASVASVSPFGYQWFFGTNQIPNATNSALVLTNLQFTNAGSYSVVVTNDSGSITSNPANLTVDTADVAIALYPGLKIDGVVGLTYGIQYSTNLTNTNGWIGVTNLTFTQPTEIWYDAVPATLAERFYRVLPGPIPIP
jgi:hypothetical protein